jgi:Zn-dependent alcohol dehydrogenases
MIQSRGYAAHQVRAPLAPLNFERRDLRPGDVLIEVQWCGVCHSDLHQVRDEWGGAIFPMVPGHEVIGVVREVGAEVEGLRAGDRVGVGCMVDSCRQCAACREDLEQFCERASCRPTTAVATTARWCRAGMPTTRRRSGLRAARAGESRSAGTGAAAVRRHHHLFAAAHWKVGPGMRVGIVGLGGLGHMALKFARAFGAEVTLFTHSPGKRDEGCGSVPTRLW